MLNIARKRRRARKIEALQKQVDTLPKPLPDSGVTRISVYWMEDRLEDFITFLNQDKNRLLDLEKSKFEYLEHIVNRSIKAEKKGC